jgi:hypothetical protein
MTGERRGSYRSVVQPQEVRDGNHSGIRKWVPALVVIVVLTIRRWMQMGPLPTGLDGGEWLAIGRDLLGGPGRITPGAYPPLVPGGIAALASLTGPVESVRFFAGLSLPLLLLAAAWAALPALGPWLTAAACLVIGSASAVTEPIAFGGYPQTVAFAAILAGSVALSRSAVTNDRTATVAAAVFFAIAALSHHLYFPLGLAAGAISVCLMLLLAQGKHGRKVAVRSLLLAMPAILLALPTVRGFIAAGYAPPLDAAPFSLSEAWQYATREATLLWTFVALSAIPALWLARDPRSPLWLAACGLYAASIAIFLVVAEPRLVTVVLTGSVFALALALRQVARTDAMPDKAIRAVCLSAIAIVALRGDGEATAFFRFYRVLDASTITAASVLERSSEVTGAAVRADRRGWPSGWWYEGLTTRRVLVGSDPRWLGFPEERTVAEDVGRLFDGSLSPVQLREAAERLGVSHLVLGKWEWIGWERWLAEEDPAVRVWYDDDRTLILALREHGPIRVVGYHDR